MESKAMESVASQYLASINGIAARIAADAATTVASFEHLWLTMDAPERASTLTDALIEPEIVLKYLRMGAPPSPVEPEPPPDEHGAPFRWHTRSQLNLAGSGAVPCGALLGAAPPMKTARPKVAKPRAPPPPPPARPAAIVATEQHDDTEALVPEDEPPSPPTEEKSLLGEYSTNYDFLNNW
ncbi:actin nucleation-promoting factor WASL-like [Phlebotomus argentipes]|uniref:actin nucleation-promoting factor WASL-like n=1 Tax=Phlebotomus argentipes TaxID=94469 RepID=UPI002892B471|nr:actin nucleation-promoting factor WASL-like [Phlebotomus argentipes]